MPVTRFSPLRPRGRTNGVVPARADLQLLHERVHGHPGGPDAGTEGDVAGLILPGVHNCDAVSADGGDPAVQHQINALPAQHRRSIEREACFQTSLD